MLSVMDDEYHAFLLRLQRNQAGDRWRILISNIETGEQRRFISDRALLAYLFTILNRPNEVEAAETGPQSSQ